MLSPGKYHLKVPREYRANLTYRKRLLEACVGNPSLQEGVWRRCKEDIVFYCNVFVYQYNPDNLDNEVGPFILWDFQEEALRITMKRLYEDRKPILWEKSRKQGATWLALILKDWMCLFHSWKKFLALSHSADAVDRSGDKDSLFWKVQFMHDYLPDWLCRGARKRKMGFAYPQTHSSFNGAGSSERSGVGGRATSVLLDELAKQTQAREIIGQTKDTGPPLYVSTHYGVGTAFYELTLRPDLHKIVMHWSGHPEQGRGLYRFDRERNAVEILDKNYQFPPDYPFVRDGLPAGGPFPGLRSPWYDAECLERDPRDVAMHLDIDPQGSVKQFFNALLIGQLIREYARPPFWVGELEHESDTAEPKRLTEQPGGHLRLWLQPNADGLPPPGHYTVGVDTSEGSGATPSCVCIFDKVKGVKVGEYANPDIEPQNLAPLVVALCRLFATAKGHGAKLIWEMQGPGTKFGKTVVELGYGNVYFREPNPIMHSGKLADEPGWMPSNEAKGLLLRDYKSALGTRHFINRSEKALDECLDFCYSKDGKIVHGGAQSVTDPSGARVNHGDRVIADALAWKIAAEAAAVTRAKEIEEAPVHSLAWRRQHREKVNKDW